MSWNTGHITVTVSVDSGGGDLQQRGEAQQAEFDARLRNLCSEYSNDAIMVTCA